MSVRLEALAELVGGTLTGDGQLRIEGAAPLRDARPGQITLADNARHFDQLLRSRATAAVVTPEVVPQGIAFITVDNARAAFAAIVHAFCPPRVRGATGISRHAHVHPTAVIAEDVTVEAGCVVGEEVSIGSGTVLHAGVTVMAGCRIGSNVTIFPRAVLYENTVVGRDCIIHAGAVIGAYGFGYEQHPQGHHLTPQLGNVIIEANVDIGANSTIDRGTYGATVIGEGTKLDNQVMIGHNCRIGKHNLLCAHVGIAGSCTTGDYVVMAGQVGVRDHIEIGDHVIIGAKSGVSGNLLAAGTYLGAPAVPVRQEIQTLMARQKLPGVLRDLRRIEKALASRQPEAHEQNEERAA